MTHGWLGTFPAGLTTGYQTIGVQTGKGAFGSWGAFPAGLTIGKLNIGAVQLNPSNSWINTFSDSVTATDTIAGLMEVNDTLLDSVTGADTQSGIVNYHQSFIDTLTGSDTQAVSAFAASATLSDPVTSSDTFSSTVATSATFSDLITASDVFTGGIGYLNTISDSISSSDSFGAAMAAMTTFLDGATSTDSVIGGIGYLNTFSDFVTAGDIFTATVSPAPNIILSGTLDFGYSFRIPHQITTYLNFGLITNDDNFIQVNLTNILTGQPVQISTVTISIYAPNTNSGPVLTPAGTPINGGFLFTISRASAQNLVPGLYSWIAIVMTTDNTYHTVTNGDINLTTGIINVIGRP